MCLYWWVPRTAAGVGVPTLKAGEKMAVAPIITTGQDEPSQRTALPAADFGRARQVYDRAVDTAGAGAPLAGGQACRVSATRTSQ